MKLAKRILAVKPSPTMAVAARAKQLKAAGVNIISLGLGEPDFPSPEVAENAGIEAIRSGETKYTPAAGTDELKEAIIHKLSCDHQLEYRKSEIIASCGAKHSLYNIAQVLFEAGDEVIIPAPYWVSYPDQILLSGATPVIVPTQEENHFLMTPEQLKSAITPRTKGVLFNSPSNPTGAVYTKKDYEAFSDLLLSKDLWVISDEIYEKFLYDNALHRSIASLGPELKKRTILVNGVSKSFSMTGWRIGYAAGPEAVIKAMTTLQSQSTSNPSSISQKAAAAALLEGEAFVKEMLKAFTKRREVMLKKLNQIEGFRCRPPAGSFYLFPNVQALKGKTFRGDKMKSSSDLASFLLEEGGVTTVPGEAFGMEGYLRLSFAASEETILSGLEKIEAAVSKLD